jgi:pimeloyl-ACP methyl ester carboxylesterase
MDRPRLLLVPEFTELEWSAIRPRFEAWAEVASFDLPGVGDEPRPEILDRSVIVKRGLDELDRRGWGRCFVAVDGWGAAGAIELALARPQVVIGMVIGHARLSQRREGDRAPINGAVWAALTELIAKDHEEFIRYAITQATGGSVSEELAGQMVDRFPADLIQRAWDLMTRDIDVGALLARLECPLLFAKHEGCLVSTEEGFDDAVAAFPHARTVSTTEAPLSSEGFADAVREFCEEIEAR